MNPDGIFTDCPECKTSMWLPQALYEAAKRSQGAIKFSCPYGHGGLHYGKGESEADKLRRERDLLAQQIAQRDDEIAKTRRQRDEAKEKAGTLSAQVKKIGVRVTAGSCSCCNRTFKQLAAHMKNKHPEQVKLKAV